MDNQNMNFNSNPYPGSNPYPPQQPQKPFNTWGLIGMISGILSIISCCCLANYIFIPMGLALFAIICFILSRKISNSGMAIAGLVLGIIGLILGGGVLILTWIGNRTLAQMGINPNDTASWNAQQWADFYKRLLDR